MEGSKNLLTMIKLIKIYCSVHIRGVKNGSPIHLRIKGEQETGISVEEVNVFEIFVNLCPATFWFRKRH
jgi:hypothetical protein